MRTIIIGDIHGCDQKLHALLDKIQPDAEDLLILLGDLFDRGPESWEVYQTVMKLDESYGDRFILLRGNHEDYFLMDNLTFSQRMAWNGVGRKATIKSFKQHGAQMEDARPFLQEKCQLFWRGGGIQAVHAGIKVDPIEENDNYTLVHDHDVVLQNQYSGPLTVVGHIALDFPTWFKGDGETKELLPPGERLPLPEHGIICIDTGCGKGGRLTAMIMEGDSYRLESV